MEGVRTNHITAKKIKVIRKTQSFLTKKLINNENKPSCNTTDSSLRGVLSQNCIQPKGYALTEYKLKERVDEIPQPALKRILALWFLVAWKSVVGHNIKIYQFY